MCDDIACKCRGADDLIAGHRQLIAGYYDEKPEKVRDWLTAAKTVPDSVIGVMYTTWRNDYSNLEPFSKAMDVAR